MKKIFIIVVSFSNLMFSGCSHKPNSEALNKLYENPIPDWNHKLTQVIIADIFTPPVCSRIFAYTNIAAYEALRPAYKDYDSYAGKLNGLQPLPLPKQGKEYCYPVASVFAFSTVAQKLVYDANAIKELEKEYLKQLNGLHMNKELLDSSVSYGRAVGNHIIVWASKDGYLQRNSLPAYIVTKEPGRWQPTPPNYADAVEPNWKTLRPLALDSSSQFRLHTPIKYDTAKTSSFYKEAYQAYDKVKNPQKGDSAIAWYWDDNPNTSITDGHITYFQQKNSPPGHWIHIACSVAQKEKYDAMKTISLVSKTSIALYDAFLSAWDTKYAYNYIRPETFINRYIDKDWEPLIQTPAFPEYPSAHSVVSSSAATLLTQIIGEPYNFTDSAEVNYGRPTRAYHSFYEAADQASISRLYGGIHFMNAIVTGKEEGRNVGNYVLNKLK